MCASHWENQTQRRNESVGLICKLEERSLTFVLVSKGSEARAGASPGRLYLRRLGVPRAYTLGPERW